MFLESFVLPTEETERRLISERMYENGGTHGGWISNVYPYRIFPAKSLKEIWFRNITIFHGSNGSGKSTLLNLIAQKLELKRLAPYNSGELFQRYAKNCRYTMCDDEDGGKHRIPDGSRILTSDDVFEYMLASRTNNNEIINKGEEAKDIHYELKYGKTIHFRSMADYEKVRLQLLARSRSVNKHEFVLREVGEEIKLDSNGETAISFFDTRLKNDTLYCLDEPENSLAPQMQKELAGILERMARYCGCQFIIATHSPFLLALDGARIHDLNTAPVETKNWWELENTRLYFDFFDKNKALFQNKQV